MRGDFAALAYRRQGASHWVRSVFIEFASRFVKQWGKGERRAPSHQKSLASWGAGLLYLPVSAPARAVNADGKASCQCAVTVQFPDPHVSGLSVNEQRQRGLWHQEKHKGT